MHPDEQQADVAPPEKKHRSPSESSKLIEALVGLQRVSDRDELVSWAEDELRDVVAFSSMACLLAEPHGRSFRIRDVIASDDIFHCLTPEDRGGSADAAPASAPSLEAKPSHQDDHVIRASTALLDRWTRDRCPMQMDAKAAIAHETAPEVAPLLECLAVDGIALHGVKEAFSGSATFFLLGTPPEARDGVDLDILELIMPSLHVARQRIYRSERALGLPRPTIGLTPREIKILALIASGTTDDETARITGRSVHTIKNQVRHLVNKLGAKNRTQAVVLASHHGLLQLAN